MNPSYKSVFKSSLFIIIFLCCLFNFPVDDGLRHVGVAFSNFKSWGDVYPFSIFEKFRDYNPWLGYDLALGIIAGVLKQLPITLLTQKFLLIKVLSLLFSLAFFYLVLVRSRILQDIKDRQTFTLALIILSALLALPFGRVILARPFAFATFFIIFSVNQKGFVRGFLASLILSLFYPYLSWLYILPVAFAHFVRGNKKFALGAAALMIIFLLIQPASFWGFQIALFKSDIVRSALNAKIDEFSSILKFYPFYLFLAAFIILFPKLSQSVKGLNYPNVLILLYLFPSFKYNRYFVDIILPLMFVSFGREILNIFLELYQKFIFVWKEIFQACVIKLKTFSKWRPKEIDRMTINTEAQQGRGLKPLIIFSYLIIGFFLIYINLRQIDYLKELQDGLNPIHEKSLVLSSFNLQYRTLFLRPDLRLIPSCEIGFATKTILREYTKFINEGKIIPILRKTGTKYFLDNKFTYVDPRDAIYLQLLNETAGFKLWLIQDPKEKSAE